MADNVGYTPGSGATIAADEIGGVLHQRIKLGIGADGTAVDVSTANPMPITAPTALSVSGPLTNQELRAAAVDVAVTSSVQTTPLDPATATAFGPVVAANTILFAALDTANERTVVLQLSGAWRGGISLQASQNGTDWFDAEGISQNNEIGTSSTVYAPDVVNVPVIARFFRAITTTDFAGSVSGSYSLRTIDPPPFFTNTVLQGVADDVRLPVAGIDPAGYPRRLTLNELGHTIPADGRIVTGTRNGASPGPIVQLETTGYGTVALQLTGTFTGTVTFQVSNDGSAWSSALAWPVAGSAAAVTTATAAGQWLIPASGRFFRAQITVAGSGFPLAIAVLKNFSAWMPASTPNIGTVTAITGGGVAEDSATTANPLVVGGVARTALPASTVIAGDAVRATLSVSGQLVTKENAPADLDFFVNATVTTSVQTQLRAAQVSPIRTNVTGLTFQNTNATATTLTIQDGATTLITFNVPGSMTLPVQLNFPTPLRGTAATALNYQAGSSGANVLLNVIGFSSY